MYFVDQNDEIITKAKYEFSSMFKQGSWRNFKYAKVNQNQKYFATYWKHFNDILFWKNKKKIQRMRTKQGISSLLLENSFMAGLFGDNLYIYFNKNKLITKTQNINFIKQITFNIHKQIIFKNSHTVEIYDFIRKSLTICDKCYISNYYEYCPINDIILIPQGDKFSDYISVWSMSQSKITNKVYTRWLKEFRIKMSKSGKYFTVTEFRQNDLNIYSFGDRITLIKKISLEKRYQEIEWILDDNYLLVHSYLYYQILQIDNGSVLDCKIQKIDGVVNNPTKYTEGNQIQRKQIFILIKIIGQLAHYYSLIL